MSNMDNPNLRPLSESAGAATAHRMGICTECEAHGHACAEARLAEALKRIEELEWALANPTYEYLDYIQRVHDEGAADRLAPDAAAGEQDGRDE